MGVVVPGSIRVLMPSGQVVVMKLETYLAGVVGCEIGANGPLEALKAQAVASRTYAASAHRHPELGADVCTTAHCQEWKRIDPIVAPEVFRAVSETWGIVAIYDGRLIDAFFFEHCDGHTRSADQAHMPAVAYLQSVVCPCGFVGMKGHGVGLCQRGAIVMARQGRSFEQILSHYYHGVVVIHSVLESGQKTALRPTPRTPISRERVPVQPNGELKNAQASTSKLKLRSPRKSHPSLSRAPGPVFPTMAEQSAPVPPEPEPSKPLPIEVSPETVQASTPAAASIEPVVPEPTAPPILASEAQVPQTATSGLPLSSTEQDSTTAESPILIEPLETEVVEFVQSNVPHDVEQPDISVSSTAEQISADPESPIAPIPDLPAVPWVHEADLPALHEAIAVKMPRMHVDHLPGGRMIAGCLPAAGVVVRLQDPHGSETLVFSGSAPHYGEGGFETMVGEDGHYIVAIGEEQVEVQVQGDTVFIHPV